MSGGKGSLRPSVIVPVEDATRVAEVRRVAMTMAEAEELGADTISNAGIVATELSTNLCKHAIGGEIHVAPLSERGLRGVEMLSIDKGPGIWDLGRCLPDGFSTAGSPGTGLGAIVRLSHEFDAYSEPGRGTVLVSRLLGGLRDSASLPPVVIGAVSKPIGSEKILGDGWGVSFIEGGAILVVADGLGHGLGAADAADIAVSTFKRSGHTAPMRLIEQIHAALRAARGAAVAVAALAYDEGSVRFAGIGNVAGRVITHGRTKHMVSHAGTAGYEARRFQEFSYELPREAAVVMHSDGLLSSWSLDNYPGLLSRDPAVIAAVLYRDATRGRDDVCVVVAKLRETV